MELPANQRVVVIDDDPGVRRYLGAVLSGGGYQCESFESASTALGWLSGAMELSSILLCDPDLPGMDGIEMLGRVRELSPDLPFIMLSGYCDEPLRLQALQAGANDYLVKPARADVLLSMVSKHVQGGIRDQLRAAGTALAAFVRPLLCGRRPAANQWTPVFRALGLEAVESVGHTLRVAAYAKVLGSALALSGEALASLETGALLHDVGKAAIPSKIFTKTGRLSDGDARVLRMHAQFGYDLLSEIAGMEPEAQIVHAHHERFDGRGYPRKLRGTRIPLAARIVSVADTLDAITSDRAYRPTRTFDDARSEIFCESGGQFDPDVVDALALTPNGIFESIRDRLSAEG